MANSDNAFGFRPVQQLGGAVWNGKVNMYYIPSTYGTAIFVGDPVVGDADAGAAGVTVNGIDVEGMPSVIVGAATNTSNRGVVVGFLPNQSNLEQLHKPASQARIALVVDDPNVVFEIQEDSVGGAIAVASVGMNADYVYTAGSTTTGRSKCTLDSSDVKSGTAQLRILGLSKRPGNILGTFAKWLVIFNEHAFKTTTGD